MVRPIYVKASSTAFFQSAFFFVSSIVMVDSIPTIGLVKYHTYHKFSIVVIRGSTEFQNGVQRCINGLAWHHDTSRSRFGRGWQNRVRTVRLCGKTIRKLRTLIGLHWAFWGIILQVIFVRLATVYIHASLWPKHFTNCKYYNNSEAIIIIK